MCIYMYGDLTQGERSDCFNSFNVSITCVPQEICSPYLQTVKLTEKWKKKIFLFISLLNICTCVYHLVSNLTTFKSHSWKLNCFYYHDKIHFMQIWRAREITLIFLCLLVTWNLIRKKTNINKTVIYKMKHALVGGTG